MRNTGNLREIIEAWACGFSCPNTTPNGSLFVGDSDDILYSYGYHFPLAMRVQGAVLVNGDYYSATTAKHRSYVFQEIDESYRVEIPFSALSRALYGGKRVSTQDLVQHIRIIEHRGDTWTENGFKKNGEINYKHTLGGCVFSYKDRYFFSGIDETGKGSHQYFLVELTRPVNSVDDGLKALKPSEIIKAEREGKEIYRQGEWFFVKEPTYLDNLTKKYVLKDENGEGHHIASEGTCIEINGRIIQVVKGIIKHNEGHHKQLKLYDDIKHKNTFIAYHNVQIASFTSDGNVD